MRLVQSKATPPVLRPGASAIDWVRRWLGACVFAVPAVLLMPFAASAAEPTRSALLGLALIVALGAGATMIFSGVQWIRTEAREREDGCATQFGKHPELWQLDPKTGAVLRRPGEPPIARRHR